VALGLIVVSMFAGFSLGYLFIGAMILLSCGYILYDTSNVLHHYRTDQHVSAALALFASLALLLWYMIQLFMRARE
jgi:FtsH-binding integral membrane protein